MVLQPQSICDVPGIRVGHAQNDEARTGCTIVLPVGGAVAGVDIRGSAPGTRDIETIKLVRLVPRIDAVLFTGGSAFGLDATGGVLQYLEERGLGFDTGVVPVPIVPTAVVFDLYEGDAKVRPDKQMGYEAAGNASADRPLEGRVGAGRGATVGKVLGPRNCMKGGVGTACDRLGDLFVGALVVVNAMGDIVDAQNSAIIAGARNPESGDFVDAEHYLKSHTVAGIKAGTNTTLAVVATDARLSREEITKVAQMAQDGFARVIRPAHTPFDGDLIVGLSVGEKAGETLSIGSAAVEVVARAILRAVSTANDL
ncbi:MAG: P1 family peptidase [bacterium]